MRILSFFVIFAVFLTPMMHAKPIDVCAHIDAQLTGKIGGIVQSFGQLDLCLCLSEIPGKRVLQARTEPSDNGIEFVLTNKVVVKAVAVMGFSYIIAELKELVRISGQEKSGITQ
ncbi:hypothetical protein DACRYDRAFT_19449 [Dacryopinax primogenitus]|uniref:Uncharacterized protein n=1 Tax=Dacryopinax primogenitus (strain DJM 731) TaxID=1858805 RepID=M5G7I6_DACPD|nr:uncharacterized protein DACRYDRAFT_19449 [Dacryopinax primogenitus]EJU06171.1 hypothetical protein DACRYDRAFT_19449 [Dacryopinax primogenitus]